MEMLSSSIVIRNIVQFKTKYHQEKLFDVQRRETNQLTPSRQSMRTAVAETRERVLDINV